MHPALGSVTEGLLTQIASHTFRGYVSALGSSTGPMLGARCVPHRAPSPARSEPGGLNGYEPRFSFVTAPANRFDTA